MMTSATLSGLEVGMTSTCSLDTFHPLLFLSFFFWENKEYFYNYHHTKLEIPSEQHLHT